MGILDVLSGKSGSGWIDNGNKGYRDSLNHGATQAQESIFGGLGAANQSYLAPYINSIKTLQQSTQDGGDAIKTGTQSALGQLQDGTLTARAMGTEALGQSTAALTGYGTSQRSALTDAQARAQGYLSAAGTKINTAYAPLVQSGQRATSAYENAVGLNGAGAASDYMNEFQTTMNPFGNFEDEQNLRRNAAMYNAQGNLGGASDLANARVTQERGNRDYQQHLTNLAGQQQFGKGALDSLSGFDMGLAGMQGQSADSYGRSMGDSYQAEGAGIDRANQFYGAQQMANAQNYGNRAADLYGTQGTRLADLYTGAGKHDATIRANAAGTLGGYAQDAYNNIATNQYTTAQLLANQSVSNANARQGNNNQAAGNVVTGLSSLAKLFGGLG